ncbi:NmrA family protein [Haladaptatus sp. W1]|uniref:NmrA/HSCARG family protein n=1 Tax=Haladaptatus sp. W1 TaxID=1897478 RepID=UPI000849B220|nr:NmrA/HSCARG family protein [Haladaptatus sp. W1]ODR79873.1 NmrA family protein [Haladaptatus sp. W1]
MSQSTPTSVLVVGATGTQGGAVVDHLLASDKEFDVHGLTRNPGSDAAQQLADRGVTVEEGNLGEKDTLRPLVEDVDAVFGVTNFWEHGYDNEVQEGTNIAEVAADVGVEHFVFSSVGGAERETGISHFDSKYEIEERIRELDLPATIVRPVFFMQNFEGMRDSIEDGTLAMALDEGVSLQMIDAENIGAFVTRAFEQPDRYRGEAFELAGDEHTLENAAIVFSAVLGREVEVQHVPIDDLREQMGDEYAVMFEWFNEHGYEADIEGLRENHDVEFTELEGYLREQGWV